MSRNSFTFGDIELFAHEDQAYADALELAGTAVTVDIVVGAAHGFENWVKGTSSAQALISRAQDWLQRILSPHLPGP